MKTLNIPTELVVYEKFPKLCEHLMAHYLDDETLLTYLESLGYQIIYTNNTVIGERFISFIDDNQYLQFVLTHS
jgi:hypothetical protein